MNRKKYYFIVLLMFSTFMMAFSTKDYVKAASIQGQPPVLEQKEKVKLSVKLTGKEKQKWKVQSVRWKSKNKKVAEINQKTGKLTACKPGITSISAIVTLCSGKNKMKEKKITTDVKVMPSSERLIQNNELLKLIPDTTVHIQQRYKQMSARFEYYYSCLAGDYYFAEESITNGVSVARSVLKNRRSYKFYNGYELEVFLGKKYDEFYGDLWSLYRVYDQQEFMDFAVNASGYTLTSRILWKNLPEGEQAQYKIYGEGGTVEYIDEIEKGTLRLLDRKKIYCAPDGTRKEIIEWAYSYGDEVPSYEVMDVILNGNEMKEVTIILDPGTKEEKTELIRVEQSVDTSIYYQEEYQPFEDAEGKIPWDGTKSMYGQTIYLIRQTEEK